VEGSDGKFPVELGRGPNIGGLGGRAATLGPGTVETVWACAPSAATTTNPKPTTIGFTNDMISPF
jgi:hypothetical protein